MMNMRILRRIAALLALSLAVPGIARAQAVIAGMVKDTSGAVLPGVTVEATSPVLIERVRSAVTDGAGRYRIEDLRPGTYQLAFSLAGFTTIKRPDVIVGGSGVMTIDAELHVGNVLESVTVTGEAPVVGGV